MYRPAEAAQMTTAMQIMNVSEKTVLGVVKKTYSGGSVIFCNFKSFGGTERQSNGITVVDDTAKITTWYNPDITSKTCLKRLSDGALFDIVGVVEDIELRHMIMQFKVQRVSGGA